MEYIDFLHKNNVDALIIQDIGMMDLIRKTYPNLELHASTQMHIHNLEGVKLIESLGLKRVVLARETSIETIKNIKENTDIELEIFCHGALCISYSGQCLMSYINGGRSANRGACAGCCRLPYDLISDKKVNENKYLLSTKDLNALFNIDKLIDTNVDSLKIEGRMKSKEYVYIVTSLYRKAIDSYISKGIIDINEEDIKNLKKVFNREFTKGFLFNENNNDIVNQIRSNHQGIEIGKVIDYKNSKAYIKLNDDLSINDGIRIIGENDIGFIVTNMLVNNEKVKEAHKNDIVTIKTEQVFKNSTVLKTTDYKLINKINDLLKIDRKVLINIEVRAYIDKPLEISFSDNNFIVLIKGNDVVKSINAPIGFDDIKKSLGKLGESIYELNNITINKDDDIFISVKELNELRRNLVEQLNNKRLYRSNYKKCEYGIELPNLKQTKYSSILVNNKEQYEKNKDKYDFIYVTDESLLNDKTILKLPRVINEYKEYDNLLLVGELGSIYKYKNIETDFSLNVLNSYSLAFLHSMGVKKVTLSYELSKENIEELIGNYKKRYNKEPNVEVITESYIEAMICKFNLNKMYNVDNTYLLDRYKNKYKIKIQNNLMIIHDYKLNKVEIEKLNTRINTI